MREALKSLASAIRDMVIAVRDGTGPIGTFFKLVSTAAATAAKDIIFLGGAIDGLRERMASPTKDTPGMIASGLKALDAYEARVAATANKDWGRELFPSLFDPTKGKKLGSLGGGAADDAAAKAAAAAAKKIQDTWDGLSSNKAQEQMDLLGTAIRDNSIQGVQDLAALGKQVLDLSAKGADIPPLLNPAVQAYGNQVAKQGIRKAIQDIYADSDKEIKKNLKSQEEAFKSTEDQKRFWDKETNAIMAAEMKASGRARGDEFTLEMGRRQEEFNKSVARIRESAADIGIPPAMLDPIISRWQDLLDKELETIAAAKRYAEIQEALNSVGTILGQLGDIFGALGVSADSFVARLTSGLQGATAAAQGAVSGFQALQAGLAKGGITGILGAVSGGLAVVSGAIGVVKSIIGVFSKPEYKKIMSDVGKSWGVSISEGLAKEIEQIAKSTGVSRTLAELLDVSKIIGESGKDPREFTGKINDL